MANIKKIKLSNGQIYSIFDEGALRVDPTSHKLVTGNTIVDKVIIDGDLYIDEVDDVAVGDYTNILVQVANGTDAGLIGGVSKNRLLEDIGGISYGMDSSTGVLSLQVGKQS